MMRMCYLMVFVFMMISSCSQGYKFYVGGRNGWVTHPSEDYNHWAQRMRFQVNDTLLFKSNKEGKESVLVVTKEKYDTCDTKDPIQIVKEDEELKLERSGPHYFISGNAEECKQGKTLIVVVLAVRPKKPQPVPVPAPAPALASAPASVSPTPSPSAPASNSPAPAPAPAPAAAAAPWTADTPAPAHQNSAAYSLKGVLLSFPVAFALFFAI